MLLGAENKLNASRSRSSVLAHAQPAPISHHFLANISDTGLGIGWPELESSVAS